MAKQEACDTCHTVIYGDTYEQWGFNFLIHTCIDTNEEENTNA